jgi:hypothetical protein
MRGRRTWLSFSTQRIFVTPLVRGPWIAVTHADEGAAPAKPVSP